MTVNEFSNAFDTLLNSYNTKAQFGEGTSKMEISLDEYEKSLFLTQAQDIIIRNYFYSHTNLYGQGIDDSEMRQSNFSWLISVGTGTALTEGTAFSKAGQLFQLPNDVLYILNERITTGSGDSYVVIPINYKEYDRVTSKAYTQPLKRQCWRLFQSDDSVESISEIITINGETISEYKVRYIKRPTPIILVDLSYDNLNIDGYTEVMECKVHPSLHIDILNEAYRLALASKGTYADAYKSNVRDPQGGIVNKAS